MSGVCVRSIELLLLRCSGLSSSFIVSAYMFNDGLHMHLYTDGPTLKKLTYLVDGRKQKTLNIIQRTSTHYTNLSMFLLDDVNQHIVNSLKEKFHHDPEKIVTAVYERWIAGTGRKPVTWQTLVDVLRYIQLNSLADEIDTVPK